MPENTFAHPIGELHFSSYRPEDVQEAMARAEALTWERVASIVDIPVADRTFANSALAVAEATEEMATVRSLVGHLASVIGGPWHPVNELAAERDSALANQLRFHQGLYRALVELQAGANGGSSLSPAERKYLDEAILNYRRDGIALAEASQEELKQVASQLSAAEVAFSRNLVEATDAGGVHVPDRAELGGLSDEFISRSEVAAAGKDLDGFWLGLNSPDFRYVMANCQVRTTRQALYRAYVSMARGPNLPLAQELLSMRRRMAQILGYKDYSDYALELRMAGSGADASAFLSRLTDLYRPAAASEHERLVAFAREVEDDPGFELDASDIGADLYYGSRLRAGEIGLDEERLRDYFALSHVRDVLFSTINTLYGLELRRVDADTWHPDVQVYEIWDGPSHLSTVWCDWYTRPGKVTGAWADAFFIAPRAGGRVEVPTLGCVVCNFPTPDSSGDSRLTLRDVETIWHEFGHFVHVTCGMTDLRQHSSFACRWDFVEAPSQIMENWVWQPEVLAKLAVQGQTGQSLPGDLLEKLLASRSFMAATSAMRQLGFGTEDLAMHRDYEGATPAELLGFYRQIRQSFMPVPLYPEDALLASFKHIFGGHEYASAYYSYKWAEAIEADFFSVFKAAGVLNPEVGARYRNEVLARGAELEPVELVKAFLGREPTPDAMLERDGILVQ